MVNHSTTEGKYIQWEKDYFFNKWCSENWTTTCKRIKLDYSLIPCTKINGFKTWNHKTLEETEGKALEIGFGNCFLDFIPKAKATKAKIKSGIPSD